MSVGVRFDSERMGLATSCANCSMASAWKACVVLDDSSVRDQTSSSSAACSQSSSGPYVGVAYRVVER